MNGSPYSFFLFRTSVQTEYDILELTPYLNAAIISGKWSFDLEDIDNVLCLSCDKGIKPKVERLLRIKGFAIEELHYLPDEKVTPLAKEIFD